MDAEEAREWVIVEGVGVVPGRGQQCFPSIGPL